MTAVNDHYFKDNPDLTDERNEVRARIWGHDFEFVTASGVFARSGLDKATKILLDASTPPSAGRTVLDLGCGWGPIACALAVTSPDTTVYAVDSNSKAVSLTSVNAAAAGVHVHACLPEAVPADVMFDEIWSNPPIRIGKTELHALLLRWLPRLGPGGTARLVVGKNLGSDSLQRWLNDEGWPTVRETSIKGFRILVVTAPDAGDNEK